MSTNTVLINPNINGSGTAIEPLLKKKRLSKQKKSDAELVQIFWAAPMEALFDDATIAPVTGCTRKTLQCDRWRGGGVLFRKIGGRILYKKSDVVAYLEGHEPITSTSEYKNDRLKVKQENTHA